MDVCRMRSSRPAAKKGADCNVSTLLCFVLCFRRASALGEATPKKPPRGVRCEKWESFANRARRKSPAGAPRPKNPERPQHPSRLASLLRAAGAVNRSAIRLEEPSIAGLPPRQNDPLDRFARFPLSELLRMIGCFALCGARPEAPRLWTPANF